MRLQQRGGGGLVSMRQESDFHENHSRQAQRRVVRAALAPLVRAALAPLVRAGLAPAAFAPPLTPTS